MRAEHRDTGHTTKKECDRLRSLVVLACDDEPSICADFHIGVMGVRGRAEIQNACGALAIVGSTGNGKDSSAGKTRNLLVGNKRTLQRPAIRIDRRGASENDLYELTILHDVVLGLEDSGQRSMDYFPGNRPLRADVYWRRAIGACGYFLTVGAVYLRDITAGGSGLDSHKYRGNEQQSDDNP